MIYLNNASTSYPKPKIVPDSVNEYLMNAPQNFGRGSTFTSNFIMDTRKLILDFFGAGNEYYVVFTSGSTEAINLVINGMDLVGKNVLITSTEHNAVIRPLKHLEKNGIITISVAQSDDKGVVSPHSIEELISGNTGLIVLNYVSNVTGTIQDVNTICGLAHQHNIPVLIDGSQAAANIEINLDKTQADYFAFTGHKSLFGMQGIGGLIFNKNMKFAPLKFGGTGFRSNFLYQPDELPHKYEAGTQNIPGIISLRNGIEYINSIGLSKIISHKNEMMMPLIDSLEQLKKIRLFYNKVNYAGSVLSFLIEGIAPEEVSYILKSSFDIEIRAGLHCVPLMHQNIGSLPLSLLPKYLINTQFVFINLYC